MFEPAAARESRRRGLKEHQRAEGSPVAGRAADQMEYYREGDSNCAKQKERGEEAHDEKSKGRMSKVECEGVMAKAAVVCVLPTCSPSPRPSPLGIGRCMHTRGDLKKTSGFGISSILLCLRLSPYSFHRAPALHALAQEIEKG